MLLTKDQIIKAMDLNVQVVDVPEWGGSVRMRALSGKARDEYLFTLQNRKAGKADMDIRGLSSKLLSLVLVDEQNNLLFSEKEVDVLNDKSADVLSRLFDAACKMNALGVDAAEEARKNS